MQKPRYILEPYNGSKTRHRCPRCEKERSFCRYIDTETKEYINLNVGRCNREVKCGYHYTPKQFFTDHPTVGHPSFQTPKPEFRKSAGNHQSISTIPIEYLKKSLCHYQSNNLVQFLLSKLGSDELEKTVNQYLIGTSKHWNGSTTFWQIDQNGHIRTGKIMHYNPNTGHRTKQPYSLITWVHKVLKLENFQLSQCFFGEHLLSIYPDKQISVVESEKTAIIASVYFPQFIWLATGGKNGCKWTSQEVFKVLKGRKVILWPDINAYDDWAKRAEALKNHGYHVAVSDLLEKNASEKERASGWDLADFLIQFSLNEFHDQSACLPP